MCKGPAAAEEGAPDQAAVGPRGWTQSLASKGSEAMGQQSFWSGARKLNQGSLQHSDFHLTPWSVLSKMYQFHSFYKKLIFKS